MSRAKEFLKESGNNSTSDWEYDNFDKVLLRGANIAGTRAGNLKADGNLDLANKWYAVEKLLKETAAKLPVSHW